MESSAALMLRAMVAVAHADGRLDTREVDLIQEIYQSPVSYTHLTLPTIYSV